MKNFHIQFGTLGFVFSRDRSSNWFYAGDGNDGWAVIVRRFGWLFVWAGNGKNEPQYRVQAS